MSDLLTKAWRFIRQWWWVIVGVAATVFAVVLAFMAKKPGTGNGTSPVPSMPTLADRAKQEVERVRLEGEVEKARVTATADAQRAEIDQIESLGQTDPQAARRKMATWLSRNF